MKPGRGWPLGVLAVMLLVYAGWAASQQAPANNGRTPVVLELFTSEGCSSCPPADALLARLDKTQPIPGVEIIALKEHVDYWDHFGWKDRFSSAQFTARQSDYALAFGSVTIYTPQMIVDGRTEFVGSAEGRARQAILQAARAPKAVVQLEWSPRAAAGAAEVPLRVRIGQLGGATPGDRAEVFLAITEGNLHSDVSRGENAGRKLDHAGVVRVLRVIGNADLGANPSFAAQPGVAIAAGWQRANLRAVVFVQERRRRRVLAAAAIAVPAE
jgi:hypothetical protein